MDKIKILDSAIEVLEEERKKLTPLNKLSHKEFQRWIALRDAVKLIGQLKEEEKQKAG